MKLERSYFQALPSTTAVETASVSDTVAAVSPAATTSATESISEATTVASSSAVEHAVTEVTNTATSAATTMPEIVDVATIKEAVVASADAVEAVVEEHDDPMLLFIKLSQLRKVSFWVFMGKQWYHGHSWHEE